MDPNESDVVVALSGGVDSSMAAVLLKMKGWQVHGLHFLLPAASSKRQSRVRAVNRVAQYLEIPIELLNLEGPFCRRVIDPFVDAYLEGRTPNPCVVCNQLIKFEFLLKYAQKHDIHYMATGHYASIRRKDESPYFELWRGMDRRKEQSYFLHRLNQYHLSRAIFPLAEKRKEALRKQACDMKLPVHSAPESQEICFLPGKDYRPLVERKKGPGAYKEGEIINEQGEIIGTHQGAFRYTIGQRQGLGIASARPYYVREIRPETNEVVVGRKEALYARRVEAEGFNWIGALPSQKIIEAQAQIRYRHEPAPGQLEVISSDRVNFTFHQPQWAVTPGQALVCYEGDRVLGGGWIKGHPTASNQGHAKIIQNQHPRMQG
jgi:tRNA-specific 2-thiouridylase